MSSKNKLIINCGTTHVSAAEFSVSSGRLLLEDFKVQELNYDYTSQAEWLSELSTSLKLLRVSGKATLIAPSHLLLTKTIKVPHVEGNRQDEVIRFEAEKNIPYDLKDVTWGYQVISDDGVEKEILLISMKASAADEFCAAVQSAGVVPESIEASSILEYNTWKYCGLENDVMILNVGARFSNLTIAREGGLFVRSFPVGGNTLTQAIADSMGQTFHKAEELKIRFFNSEALNSNSTGAEHFTNSAQGVMRRIGVELTRSIVNYRRSGRVETPHKIYLSGRASLLPGFAEFLAENQKMDVEYLDALSNISVSPKVNQSLLNDNASIFGELVGEAACMVLPDAKSVNLLPQHIVKDAEFSRKRPLVVISAAILAAAIVPPYLYLSEAIKEKKSATVEFNKLVQPLVQRYETLKANEAKVKSLTTKISGLEGLAESKSNWINLFIDLEKRLMEQKDVWLDNLRVVRSNPEKGAPEYKLELTGRLLLREVNPDDPATYDNTAASERIQKLLTSFTDSEFIKSFENITTDPSNPRILKFDFTLVVNPDKPI